MELNNFLLSIDEDGIAVFTANRPEKLNAMDATAWHELLTFFTQVNERPDVHAVIITGAGEKAFIAGADISALWEKTPANTLSSPAPLATRAIELCCKPVIAAVNGYAFGGGCEIAAACDLRIVPENAVFGLPEVTLGILPGAGGTQRLAKLIGVGRAKEMILAGKNIKAQEAVSIGLASQCVPLDTLLSAAKQTAKRMLAAGPISFQLCKKLLDASMSADLESGLWMECLSLAVTCGTQDKHEGVQAFLEKRLASFQGK